MVKNNNKKERKKERKEERNKERKKERKIIMMTTCYGKGSKEN